MTDGSVVKPTDPLTVFNAVWDLRDARYEDATITFRIITRDGWERTVESVPDRRDGQFEVCPVWDYTDEARYITMMPERPDSDYPKHRMLEAGDAHVAFRTIGTQTVSPDDCYDHRLDLRRRQAVNELEVVAVE